MAVLRSNILKSYEPPSFIMSPEAVNLMWDLYPWTRRLYYRFIPWYRHLTEKNQAELVRHVATNKREQHSENSPLHCCSSVELCKKLLQVGVSPFDLNNYFQLAIY